MSQCSICNGGLKPFRQIEGAGPQIVVCDKCYQALEPLELGITHAEIAFKEIENVIHVLRQKMKSLIKTMTVTS